jgi:hypothetical protein
LKEEEVVVAVEGFFHQMVEVVEQEDQEFFLLDFSWIYVVSFYVFVIFLHDFLSLISNYSSSSLILYHL